MQSERVELTSGKIDLGAGKFDTLDKRYVRLVSANGVDSYSSESSCEIIVIREKDDESVDPKEGKRTIGDAHDLKRRPSTKSKIHPGIEAMTRIQGIFDSIK